MSGGIYCALNESTAPEVTHEVLCTKAADIQLAYDRDFAPEHGLLPVDVVVADIAASVPAGVRILHIVDEIPEAPGDLAYHTVENGVPVLRLGVNAIRSQGGNLLDEITKAWSHEVFETAKDAYCVLCVIVPGNTKRQMCEVCDPCQGGSYRVNETAISNFCTAQYFNPRATSGPYDKCGQLSAPLSCADDGYIAWDDGSQTFGEKVPQWKRDSVINHGRQAAARKVAA